MAYVKNIWVDQDVERPKTYEVTNNQDGSITLTDSFGLVTELGTPVNEVNMNHIEDGIYGCAIRKHNLTETFNLGEWVLGGTGDDEGIYKSLIDNNVGNAISDDTKWEKVELGGGSFRNIGEIVASTIPLTDAGLHLLDGALLQYGSYQAFIDYIADLYDSGDYTAIFDTEANWQATVALTGICSKFVYDSVNNTVRLPKWGTQAFTKGSSIDTASTVNVKGNGKTLGLYDGTNYFGLVTSSTYIMQGYGAQYNKNVGTTPSGSSYALSKSLGVTNESTKSGLVVDTTTLSSSLTNYPLDCYYYIVIATSTKTDIQVDIDEIATDLNGKADTDLTNISSSCAPIDGQWVASDTSVVGSSSGLAAGDYTYSLSSYLPNDSYNYEVIFNIVAKSASENTVQFQSSFIAPDADTRAYCQHITNTNYTAQSLLIPIGTNRNVTVHVGTAGTNYMYIRAYAYRRIGTNS